MKPGMVCTGLNRWDSLATFVESAEPGRNEELSFFWTSASLLWNEPPAAPSRKNRMARAVKIHTTRGRRVVGAAGSRFSSSLVTTGLLGGHRYGRRKPYRDAATAIDGVSPRFTPDICPGTRPEARPGHPAAVTRGTAQA